MHQKKIIFLSDINVNQYMKSKKIKRNFGLLIHFVILLSVFLVFSCKKERYGNIIFHFTQTIDGQHVQYNQLIYTNTAGNQYQVNEIKYFISKVFLTDDKGESVFIKQDDGIHYIDNSLNNTLFWKINDVPQRNYVAVSFVFGLDKDDNMSNRFVNPPESNFSWPQVLGGGYHYMQINGKFLTKNGVIKNLNIHTGIGQLYDENNEVTQFIHNYITVSLPVIFSVSDSRTSLNLNMEIQRWFDTPNVYNFDEFGTGIMQNQHAQQLLKQNVEGVFEMRNVK